MARLMPKHAQQISQSAMGSSMLCVRLTGPELSSLQWRTVLHARKGVDVHSVHLQAPEAHRQRLRIADACYMQVYKSPHCLETLLTADLAAPSSHAGVCSKHRRETS